MIERGITEAEIEDVLANPAVTAPSRDAPGHRVVVRGTTSQGRRLMIVVATDDPEFVITAASPDEE